MGWEHFAGHCYLALDQVAFHTSCSLVVPVDRVDDVVVVDLDYGEV